jgi:hypothetical protein
MYGVAVASSDCAAQADKRKALVKKSTANNIFLFTTVLI